MVVLPQTREVKQLVLRTFLELGVTSTSLFGLKETSLIEDEACLARTYRADGFKAIWSLEEGTVKFFDQDGSLVRIVNVLREKVPQLMAA
jgi:hypothetical protein